MNNKQAKALCASVLSLERNDVTAAIAVGWTEEIFAELDRREKAAISCPGGCACERQGVEVAPDGSIKCSYPGCFYETGHTCPHLTENGVADIIPAASPAPPTYDEAAVERLKGYLVALKYNSPFEKLHPADQTDIRAEVDSILAALGATVAPEPAYEKHQACGCVLCTCENPDQCQGCGAKFCGRPQEHTRDWVHEPPNDTGAMRKVEAERDTANTDKRHLIDKVLALEASNAALRGLLGLLRDEASDSISAEFDTQIEIALAGSPAPAKVQGDH